MRNLVSIVPSLTSTSSLSISLHQGRPEAAPRRPHLEASPTWRAKMWQTVRKGTLVRANIVVTQRMAAGWEILACELRPGEEAMTVLDPYVLRAFSGGLPDPVKGKVRLAASKRVRTERTEHETSRPEGRGLGWGANPGLSASFSCSSCSSSSLRAVPSSQAAQPRDGPTAPARVCLQPCLL